MNYKVGDKVYHPRWGFGEITKIELLRSHCIDVKFDSLEYEMWYFEEELDVLIPEDVYSSPLFKAMSED